MTFSFILSFAYLKMMDCCAWALSWMTVVLIQASLILLGYLSYAERQSMIAVAGYDETTAAWLEASYWICWILAGIYYLVMACNFKSLRVSIAIIETAADYFSDTKRIMIIPVIYFMFGLSVFLMWIYGVLCIASIGDITGGNYNLQSKDVNRAEITNWMIFWMVWGMIWIGCFIVAMNEFVVICSATSWYFSRKDIADKDGIQGDSDIWKGMYWSWRYHCGSLALGSFILSLFWIIRGLFEYIGEKMNKASGENACTKCLVCCIMCCLDCFDRFMRFLTTNAYIYMAISGDSFCKSALHAFLLVLKNKAKFAFVNGIEGIFMFLAKFCISIFTTLFGWFLIEIWIN